MHARHDTLVVSAPGRAAARSKLDSELLARIDPDNTLAPEERERRLTHERSAHFAALALKRVRRGKKKAKR